MKLRKNRRGFTIVELVIVVAVIGVLAAVLIPTFVNLTNKANKAADDSLVKNLNTALAMAENDDTVYKGKAVNVKNETMHDAVIDLEYEGYHLENLTTRRNYNLLWDVDSNRFFLEDAKEVKGSTTPEQFWKIVKSVNDLKVPGTEDEFYSGYANTNFNESEKSNVQVYAGFDVGEVKGFTSVSYDRSADTNTRAKNVIFRTTSSYTALAINAPKDHVLRTGVAGKIEPLVTADNSFVDHGKSSWISLSDGRYVLTSQSDVGILYLGVDKNNAEQKLAITYERGCTPLTQDQIKKPALGLGENETVKIVEITYEETNTTETIYLQGSSTFEEGKVLVSSDGGQTMAPVSSDDASEAAKAVANDYNGGDVQETGLTEEEKQQEQEKAVEEANIDEIEESDEFVARIGTVGYASLKDAVAAAQANDTIEMTANDPSTENVSVNKVVTIRMNNNTFGGTIVVATTGTNPVTVVGEANIDAVVKYGNMYFNSFVSANNATVVLLKDITLTNISVGPNKNFIYDLNGHTITLTKSDSSQGAIYLQNNYQEYDGARLTIKDGNLNFTGTGSSVGIFAYGELNLLNVNITSTCAYAIETQPDAYCGKGIVNINGGSITTAKTAIYALAANDKQPSVSLNGVEIVETGSQTPISSYGAAVEITDCIVRTTGSASVISTGDSAIGGAKSKVIINSGTFDGSVTKTDGHELFVKGGSFKVDPSSVVNTSVYNINLVDGYYVVTLDNSRVGVSIDGIPYASLEQAINEYPNSGKTISLERNNSEELVIDHMADFVLNENGYSFTGSITAGEGYNLVNLNGHYMITPPPQAQIGETTYLTLGAAIGAILKGQAPSGSTIVLLSDTEVETYQITKPSSAKTFTIQTNGFAINTTIKAPNSWTSIYIFKNNSYLTSISQGNTYSLASLGDVEIKIQ